MDPFTLTLLIMAVSATLASTAMSYTGQKEAGKQAKYNADHQAKVEEMRAEEERALRSAQERQERKQARMRRASIEADFAANGLAMTGTPVFMLEEQAKVDEMNILEGNRVSETGFMRSMERAKIIRDQGKFDKDAADYGATTTLISGAGNIAGMGASFGAAGGFGPKAAAAPKATGTYAPSSRLTPWNGGASNGLFP
jgi:hypothetical protein